VCFLLIIVFIRRGSNLHFPRILSAIVSGVVIGLMFLGLRRRRKWFVLPHLVYQVIGIATLSILAVILLILIGIGGVGSATATDSEVRY